MTEKHNSKEKLNQVKGTKIQQLSKTAYINHIDHHKYCCRVTLEIHHLEHRQERLHNFLRGTKVG